MRPGPAPALHLQALGIPTPTGKRLGSLCTLRAILRQPAYTGQVFAGLSCGRPPRIRRSATHPIGRPHESLVELPREAWIPVAAVPALVSPERFELAQRRLAQNASFARRNNTAHRYLLRALVSCGVCQAACTGRHAEGRYTYYVCSGKGKALHTRKAAKCPSRFAPAAQLDALVWRDLCEVLAHPESLTPALARATGGQWLPQQLQARRDQLRRVRRQVDQQLERLIQAYLGGVLPLAEYERRRRELEGRQRGLDQQDERLTGQADRQAEVAGMVSSVEAFCQRVRAGLDGATFEQQRQLVELLIDRVIVADGDVEIRYVIPTDPSSESVRFCHLRTDYFDGPIHGDDRRVGRRPQAVHQGLVEYRAALVQVDGAGRTRNASSWRWRARPAALVEVPTVLGANRACGPAVTANKRAASANGRRAPSSTTASANAGESRAAPTPNAPPPARRRRGRPAPWAPAQPPVAPSRHPWGRGAPARGSRPPRTLHVPASPCQTRCAAGAAPPP